MDLKVCSGRGFWCSGRNNAAKKQSALLILCAGGIIIKGIFTDYI